MNKKYSILHLPILSFFSKRLYRDVGHNWKGSNLSYLFVLLAICWIPPTLRLQEDINQSLKSAQMQLITQLPDIRIIDGRVVVDENQPYYIERNGQTVAIIDTTGSMNYIDDENVVALLTESELIMRRGKNQFNTLNLSKVESFHLNQEIANQWMEMTRSSLTPLAYGFFVLLSYFSVLLLMFCVSIAGFMISSMLRISLRFSGVLRIAMAAATPAIILTAASIVLGQSVPGIIYLSVTLIYLLAGIIICSRPAEEEAVPRLKLASLLDEENEAHQSHAA